MAGELPPSVSSEVESSDRAKSRNALSAARRALLGGRDAREKLAQADAEAEVEAEARREERQPDLRGHLLVAAFAVVAISWSWFETTFSWWNLVWFIPLLFFAAHILYTSDRLFDSGGYDAGPFGASSRDHHGDEVDDDPGLGPAEVDGETGAIHAGEEPAMLAPDTVWSPPTGTWVKPRADWAFVDTIDGELAEPFEVQIEESGATLFDGRRGWRGRIRSARHKYGYMDFIMRPRHAPFDGIVSIDVTNGGRSIYSGVADTRGLDRDWS